MRVCVAIMLIALSWPAAAVSADPCLGKGTAIVVRLNDRRLSLCRAGSEVRSFPVSSGRAGSGKAKAGDKKTPVGWYALGRPQASRQFHTFIPIGYPTLEQRKRGLTGSAVGVHGPSRQFKWAGRMNSWFDWTRGCIALPSDEAIDAVSAWVRKNEVRRILIEDEPD